MLFLGGKLLHLHICPCPPTSSRMSGLSFSERMERKGKGTHSYASPGISSSFLPAHPQLSCEVGLHKYSHFIDLEMKVHEEVGLAKVMQRITGIGRIGLWSLWVQNLYGGQVEGEENFK